MNMYKYILSVLILTLCAAVADAKGRDDEKVRFAYDVDFEMNFDNREFYRSDFSESMTIFGARLTPSVGISIPQYSKGMNHRIMMGIDVMKNFGASPVHSGVTGIPSDETAQKQNNLNLFQEITLYYKLDKRTGNTGLELYAGIFPRKTMAGSYSEAFFSDSLKFYDNNLEGLLLKIRRPKAYWEVGCDWIGCKGYARKEKFMLFSAGESNITPWLEVGYAAYMYHFAGSEKARGVVDNILMNPYAKFDFGGRMGFREFSFRFGWLQSMQHDREFVGHYVFPGGGEFDLTMRKWNVGVRNSLFYGMDMMPYYNGTDAAGDKYGTRLYFGDPFYRIYDGRENPDSSTIGLYDRLDIFYEPHIGKYLNIRLGARFHFNNMKYSGCQQMVGIVFDLNKLNDYAILYLK